MWALQQHNLRLATCASASRRFHPPKPSPHLPVTPLTEISRFHFYWIFLLLCFLRNEMIRKVLRSNNKNSNGHLLLACSCELSPLAGRGSKEPGLGWWGRDAGERGTPSRRGRRENGQAKCYFPFHNVIRLFYQSMPWARTTLFVFLKKSVFITDNHCWYVFLSFSRSY